MSLWMIPFFLFWGAVEWLGSVIAELAPAIGVGIGAVSAVAVVLSIAALVLATRLLHHDRRWVRGLSVLLILTAALAAMAFALVAVIAFVAVATLG